MTIFDLLIPRQTCPLCLTSTDNNLCSSCLEQLPFNHYSCPSCALPLNSLLIDLDQLCGECLTQPPAFQASISPFIYQTPVKQWLRRFKYQGNLADGERLVKQLIIAAHNSRHAKPDFLIPVPMHWRKRMVRGFNQTDWLARRLSSSLNVPILNALTRNAGHAPQSHSNRSQRQSLHGVYQLKSGAIDKIKDKRIALIDDVVTTGATSRAISKILSAAKTKRVEIWSLARTAKY